MVMALNWEDRRPIVLRAREKLKQGRETGTVLEVEGCNSIYGNPFSHLLPTIFSLPTSKTLKGSYCQMLRQQAQRLNQVQDRGHESIFFFYKQPDDYKERTYKSYSEKQWPKVQEPSFQGSSTTWLQPALWIISYLKLLANSYLQLAAPFSILTVFCMWLAHSFHCMECCSTQAPLI